MDAPGPKTKLRHRKLKGAERQQLRKAKQAKADAQSKQPGPAKAAEDRIVHSIATHTKVPRPSLTPAPDRIRSIPSDKLKAQLVRTHDMEDFAQDEREAYSSLLLPKQFTGIQVESDLERTWKVSQQDIVAAVSNTTASKAFQLEYDDPIACTRWTHDGRYLLTATQKGHIATLDPEVGRLLGETQVRERTYDAWYRLSSRCMDSSAKFCERPSFLHNHLLHAVAQKKYVYIYDSAGLEIHRS